MKLKGVIILTTIIALLSITIVNYNTISVSSTNLNDEPYALILVGNGTVEEGNYFNLTMLLNNPTSYRLENVTFWLEIPIELEIISNVSSRPTQFDISFIELENSYNITCLVESVEKNSIYTLNIELKGSKIGKYSIKLSNIKAVKVKGEYTKEITIASSQELQLQIVKKTIPRYPPEGETDPSLYILIFTIILPVIIMILSRRIAWRA